MGQYYIPMNLTKKEFIDPHKLGNGLKIWEQVASGVGTGTALMILTVNHPESRGGGDLCLSSDDEAYNEVAARTIGRWAGDKIVIVGDYAEDGDMAPSLKASTLYGKCRGKDKEVTSFESDKLDDGTPHKATYRTADGKFVHHVEVKPPKFKDITEDVCQVIEHELEGKYEGDGWRTFKYGDQETHTPCECCRAEQSKHKDDTPALVDTMMEEGDL